LIEGFPAEGEGSETVEVARALVAVLNRRYWGSGEVVKSVKTSLSAAAQQKNLVEIAAPLAKAFDDTKDAQKQSELASAYAIVGVHMNRKETASQFRKIAQALTEQLSKTTRAQRSTQTMLATGLVAVAVLLDPSEGGQFIVAGLTKVTAVEAQEALANGLRELAARSDKTEVVGYCARAASLLLNALDDAQADPNDMPERDRRFHLSLAPLLPLLSPAEGIRILLAARSRTTRFQGDLDRYFGALTLQPHPQRDSHIEHDVALAVGGHMRPSASSQPLRCCIRSAGGYPQKNLLTC
jgi:hypothetical protein